jgi:1D-myo-inositol 3-kinase
MPRMLAVGHVTWDRLQGREVLGGSASYAALAAQKLGWEAGVLTSAGPDFDPARDLPGVAAFVQASPATTRFQNDYDSEGTRRQYVTARARPVTLDVLPEVWRTPDVLFLCPVAAELDGAFAPAFGAEVVGATAQGWLRRFDDDGAVSVGDWDDPGRELQGVHALVFSEHDIAPAEEHARRFLQHVPLVLLTRGWQGLQLYDRQGIREVPTLPRSEEDPTGAGDVFAAAFLLRYQETGDPEEAAAFGACAASCVVEGLGASRLGDRAEIERRLAQRDVFLQGDDPDGAV